MPAARRRSVLPACLLLAATAGCSGSSQQDRPDPLAAPAQTSPLPTASPSASAPAPRRGGSTASAGSTPSPSAVPAPPGPANGGVFARRPGAPPVAQRLTAPVVPLDGRARYPDGVVVLVRDVTRGTTSDTGPGALPGQPVTSFVLEVVNSSGRPLEVSEVVVAVTHGPSRRAADPVYGGGQNDFSGTVPPGGTASATYAFALPVTSGTVTLTVDVDGRHAPAVFRGTLAPPRSSARPSMG